MRLEQGEPWEQLEAETELAFSAFLCYRNLPPRQRTYRAAGEAYFAVPPARPAPDGDETGERRIIDPNEPIVSPGRMRSLELWARKYHWRVRARAWDRFKDRAAQAATIKAIEDMARRQAGQVKMAAAALLVPTTAIIKKASRFGQVLQEIVEKEGKKKNPSLKDIERVFGIVTRAAKELPKLLEAEHVAMGILKKEVEADDLDLPRPVMGGIINTLSGGPVPDDGEMDEL